MLAYLVLLQEKKISDQCRKKRPGLNRSVLLFVVRQPLSQFSIATLSEWIRAGGGKLV